MENSVKIKKIIKVFKEYKIYIISLVIIVLSIVSVLIQEKDRNNLNINGFNINSSTEGKIGVYITGEIKNPGVYYLNKDSRVDKLIDVSGGLTQYSDLTNVNLSKKLNDGEKIVIPKIQEKQDIDVVEIDGTEKININEATKEELMTLEGIGESTADKILEYRNNQEFIDVEDIKNVPGIGDSKFDKIKDLICT